VIDSLDDASARGLLQRHMEGIVRPLLEWDTKFIPAETASGVVQDQTAEEVR
jgi:hypothetical protein